MNKIEVCLSPLLYESRTITDNYIVVIVDVLRATTSFCAAFDSGIEIIIPVSGLDELREYKSKGFLTAAEREGAKVDFADYGNSPSVFRKQSLANSQLAYSTTNGTQAIEKAKGSGQMAILSFSNLSALAAWLLKKNQNILILCSGWKNSFSLEDTLCAGALVETLQSSAKFTGICDASHAALTLWVAAKNNLLEEVKQANHYQRLFKLGLHDDLDFCFRRDTSKAIPVWDGAGFRDLSSGPYIPE